MNIYKITFKYSYNNEKILTVAAKNIDKALEFLKRRAKKNYWNEVEVIDVSKYLVVDIYYKS